MKLTQQRAGTKMKKPKKGKVAPPKTENREFKGGGTLQDINKLPAKVIAESKGSK